MLSSLAVELPSILAAVLIASAIGKLRHPDDLAAWAELGIPPIFRRSWLLRLHPWGELALGVALTVLGGILGLLAALAACALLAAYTWVIVRAAQQSEEVTCACFGRRMRVTRVTVVRNVWLTLVAVAAAAVIWTTPLLGGVLAAGAASWLWIVGLAIAVVTSLLIVWPDVEPEAAQPPDPAASGARDEEFDYIRTRTPAVPVTLADGTAVNLRTLAQSRPILLLAVSETCGYCEPVVERAPAWRALLPEVDIRLLLESECGASRWTELTEPQSLHDPESYVRGSIADWGTPSAVLFGIDGLLAGGPVTGLGEISTFVSDVYESLHGGQPVSDRHVPATTSEATSPAETRR